MEKEPETALPAVPQEEEEEKEGSSEKTLVSPTTHDKVPMPWDDDYTEKMLASPALQQFIIHESGDLESWLEKHCISREALEGYLDKAENDGEPRD